MVSNKKRLYVAMYADGDSTGDGQYRYRWTFVVGPKLEKGGIPIPGKRYYVKRTPSRAHAIDAKANTADAINTSEDALTGLWNYKEEPVRNIRGEDGLLARILVAKLADVAHFERLVRTTPVVNADTWMAAVIQRLQADGRAISKGRVVRKLQLNWAAIETCGRAYVGHKMNTGRYRSGNMKTIGYHVMPLWSMLTQSEIHG